MALIEKTANIKVDTAASKAEPTFTFGATEITKALLLDSEVSDLFSAWYKKTGLTNTDLMMEIKYDPDKDGDGKHNWICIKILDNGTDVFKRDIEEAYLLEGKIHRWFIIKNLKDIVDKV